MYTHNTTNNPINPMPKQLRRNIGKLFKTRRKFFKNGLMFRLQFCTFESIINLKIGQPISGYDKKCIKSETYEKHFHHFTCNFNFL